MERNAPSTSPVRRCEGTLDSAPFRLIARHLRASYEWYAHAPLAVEAGVPAAAIEAIRTGATPSFAATDQVLVHRVVTELIDTKWLADTHLCRGELAVRRARDRRTWHDRPAGGFSPDGQHWIACRPCFFLSVRVLSRLFRRLFLERLTAAHHAGRLQFFADQAVLAEPAGQGVPRNGERSQG
jgi:hypothetical protein